jgi:DNA-binding XRE family transcriptional regulator
MGMAITIEKARKCAGITQARMASELHVSTQTYAKLEKDSNKFSAGQIKKISELTGIPVQKILDACGNEA